MIILIAAMADNNVIGRDGDLPWHLPEDMQHFKDATTGNTVVMGRKTYESIGRPLPDRDNIVVSTQELEIEPKVCHSIDDALDTAEDMRGDTYIIGGASIYEQTINEADKLIITHVKRTVDGDARFPAIDPLVWDAETVRETEEFTIKEYTRCS